MPESLNNTKIYVACVNAEDGGVLYACLGSISQWGQELPDGDVCKLTYSMVIEDDEPSVTVPNKAE